MRILVSMSGGLDSSILAAYLKEQGHLVYGMHVSYGHKSQAGELASIIYLGQELAIRVSKITMDLARHLQSSLTAVDIQNPICHHSSDAARITFVPNRNAILLSIAYGLAMSQQCDAIAYAAHADDYKLYPDCRDNFAKALHAAFKIGNDSYTQEIELLNPFVNMRKAEVLKLGDAIGLNLAKTWTCYNSGEVQCGQCAACSERKTAFMAAGLMDMTEYACTINIGIC